MFKENLKSKSNKNSSLSQGNISNTLQMKKIDLDSSRVLQKQSGTQGQINPLEGAEHDVRSLPKGLREKAEATSGMPMDDVKVHYNSDKPIQMKALAYTQGSDIHIGPGQEKYLPHELGHVVQQKQGRVDPTFQLKGINVNDNSALEREADNMFTGSTPVTQMKSIENNSVEPVVQRVRINLSKLRDEKGDKVVNQLENSEIRGIKGDYHMNIEKAEGFLPNRYIKKLKECSRKITLDKDEDVVFEGHGKFDWMTVVGLQRFSPKNLAEFAHTIPKPDNWEGRIILAGCQTKDIVNEVSKEYYNLKNEPVSVLGTHFKSNPTTSSLKAPGTGNNLSNGVTPNMRDFFNKFSLMDEALDYLRGSMNSIFCKPFFKSDSIVAHLFQTIDGIFKDHRYPAVIQELKASMSDNDTMKISFEKYIDTIESYFKTLKEMCDLYFDNGPDSLLQKDKKARFVDTLLHNNEINLCCNMVLSACCVTVDFNDESTFVSAKYGQIPQSLPYMNGKVINKK